MDQSNLMMNRSWQLLDPRLWRNERTVGQDHRSECSQRSCFLPHVSSLAFASSSGDQVVHPILPMLHISPIPSIISLIVIIPLHRSLRTFIQPFHRALCLCQCCRTPRMNRSHHRVAPRGLDDIAVYAPRDDMLESQMLVKR